MKKGHSKGGLRDKAILIIPLAFVAVVVFMLVHLLVSSYHLKQCKTDLQSLATSSYQIYAEHDGTRVKFNNGNLSKLSYYFEFVKMWNPKDDVEAKDELKIEFKGDTDWTVTIYEIDDDTLRYVVDGDKHYDFFSLNNGNFKDYCKLFSGEGWDIANKVIKQ